MPDGYEKVSSVYEKEGTRVYLIRHKELGELRILKYVRKSNAVGNEAAILKGLRHPSIPILYDYKEDTAGICLIEEYVRGMSLKERLCYMETVSVTFVIRCMVQLCEVIAYLHAQKPFPILHLDLKPEHIILRGEGIVLVDYGAALYQPRSGSTFQKYGTISYMAPEAMEGNATTKSDIYSIAKIAEEAFAYTDRPPSPQMKRLLRRAMAKEPADRPQTVEELAAGFEKALRGQEKKVREADHLLQQIAVTGNAPGVGCTHVAMALTAVLNAMGGKACYINHSAHPNMHHLVRNRAVEADREGIMCHDFFRAVPDYGEAVARESIPYGLAVTDCGTNQGRVGQPDMHIHVVGTRMWQDMEIAEEVAREADIILLNPNNRHVGRQLAGVGGKPVYGFPMDENPWHPSKEKQRLFNQLRKGWEQICIAEET